MTDSRFPIAPTASDTQSRAHSRPGGCGLCFFYTLTQEHEDAAST